MSKRSNAPALASINDYHAIFFGMWGTVPTFHGFNFDSLGTESERTRCGLQLEQAMRSPDVIPMCHAVVFGRACRHCFPEAA